MKFTKLDKKVMKKRAEIEFCSAPTVKHPILKRKKKEN